MNVECYQHPECSRKDRTKKLPKNVSITTLQFKFLPRTGESKLDRWILKEKNPVDIERWGLPYGSYTCVVSGFAYVPIAVNRNKIRWMCCSDGDDLCVWNRISTTKKNRSVVKKKSSTSMKKTSTPISGKKTVRKNSGKKH